MNIGLSKKILFLTLLIIYGCSQNSTVYKYKLYNKKNNNDYKICLADANYNIEKADNINEDRAFVLQTDDTMVDFYNIDNDIDKMELSNKRKEMVKECIENRKKK